MEMPPRRADMLAHVPEKHSLAKAGLDTGFPIRTCATPKEVERIPVERDTL
jgi:hypothetical protein